MARKKTKRRPPKGFKTWKAYMASIRPGANPPKKRKSGARKMARKRKAARRKASRIVIVNPRHKRARAHGRRRYHRNPGARGIVNTLVAGAKDALGIEAGRIASRAIPTAVNKALPADKQIPAAGALGIGMQIVAGFAAALVAEKVKRGSGRLVLAGAITAPLESYLATAGIPVVSEALGAYPMEYQLGSFTPGVGTVGALGSYPGLMASGMGSYPEEAYAQQM